MTHPLSVNMRFSYNWDSLWSDNCFRIIWSRIHQRHFCTQKWNKNNNSPDYDHSQRSCNNFYSLLIHWCNHCSHLWKRTYLEMGLVWTGLSSHCKMIQGHSPYQRLRDPIGLIAKDRDHILFTHIALGTGQRYSSLSYCIFSCTISSHYETSSSS